MVGSRKQASAFSAHDSARSCLTWGYGLPSPTQQQSIYMVVVVFDYSVYAGRSFEGNAIPL